MTTGDKIKKSVIYILLVLLAAACLFPFLLMMVNATRDGVEITHFFTLIPSTHLKENWETVFSFFNLFRGMANSLLVAVPATLLTAYFSALTAYGLAMYRFRGNKLIFTAILVRHLRVFRKNWRRLPESTVQANYIPSTGLRFRLCLLVLRRWRSWHLSETGTIICFR